MNHRQNVLALLTDGGPSRLPCFSGLVNVTVPGLESLNYRFSEVHQDALKMARAAATSYYLYGFESAVVPLDLCLEAEALGAKVDFRESEQLPVYPIVRVPLANDIVPLRLPSPKEVLSRGRIPLVLEAIAYLKEDVGNDVAIGAYLPGPFTLSMYLLEPAAVLAAVVDDQSGIGSWLDALTEILSEVALAYRQAGADFLTIHEMGGSPGFLGRASFRSLVLPRLQRLVAVLPPPRVLSVCGRTDRAMSMLAQVGAEAISVDQLNDVARSRKELGDGKLLFGNIDPVAILADGDEASVIAAVEKAFMAGVDAIWPGCDLWPTVTAANMRALVKATQQISRS